MKCFQVINKKIWRGIIKGLNLPSSVTSAAFTLRTQYMKYLYPYECSTLKLSSPSELQCAIDGNRRDTSRRPSIGQFTSMVDPEVDFYSNSTSPKSNCSSPTLKRTSSPTMTQSVGLRLPVQNEFVAPSFHGNNGIGFSPSTQRIITSSSSGTRALKFDGRAKSPSYTNDRSSYEPPYKKSANGEDLDKQILLSPTPWANIKIRTSRGDIHENGEQRTHNTEENGSISASKSPKPLPVTSFNQVTDDSLIVSIELNGVKYQGVLFAQHR